MRILAIIFFFLSLAIDTVVNAQVPAIQTQPWNLNAKLNSYRMFDIMPGTKPVFIDLDSDGHPDVMRYNTANGFSVQWIDNNHTMKLTDTCGNMVDDCLMVDVNKDGKYGSYGDVIIRWVDTNNDGRADIQIYVEFASEKDKNATWGPGHFMVNMDLDKDDIMNYIDWNTFQVRAWIHNGRSDFFEDYSGKTLFLKIHSSPEKINDLRLNWENPFLFYDPDRDGLTEYAIRLLDVPVSGKPGDKYLTNLTGKISYVAMSYDMVNDHTPKHPFSYDMTINFRGEGFNYMDQLHTFKNLRGLPAADQYFMDPRINQLEGFIYPDHDTAPKMIFEKGKWNEVWFTYDEDNDCERWERVELYEPKDPYIIGANLGGLDNNAQSDPLGDRGEWDLDNSGKGNLYISPLDGKIHLYGAEKGYWRVDQNAFYYQGMGGLYDGYGPFRTPLTEPTTFPLISYKDTDNDGFFDVIEFDLDGDKKVDFSYSLKELGIIDKTKIYDISKMKYVDFTNLQKKVATDTWQSALNFVKFAETQGLNTQWYALLKHPKSIRQQYSQGYWLKFYLFMDCLDKAKKEHNTELVKTVVNKYFGH
jgi:hypothetical protein